MAIATRKGASKQVKDILDEDAKEKERIKRVTVYLPESLYKEIRRYCFERETTMAAFLRDLGKEKMDEEKELKSR